MVAAAALHDAGTLEQDEAIAWADALAVVVEDGQVDAPRVLLARVVDRVTAERVRAALLGRMGGSDAALAATVEEVYRAAVAVPAGELPEWAEAGIWVPDGRLMLSYGTPWIWIPRRLRTADPGRRSRSWLIRSSAPRPPWSWRWDRAACPASFSAPRRGGSRHR
jgi:hypothetical protein